MALMTDTAATPPTSSTPDLMAILAIIPTLGIYAGEDELRYQLHKAGHPAGATSGSLLEALAELEERGLVAVSLVADLTAAGRQAVADAGQAPPDETVYPPFPAPRLIDDGTPDEDQPIPIREPRRARSSFERSGA